jgi:hypothetical protein
MNIMELGAIGELVGGVAVIGSLLYVGLQVRQSNHQAKQRLEMERNEADRQLARECSARIAQLTDPGMSNLIRRGLHDFKGLNGDDQLRFDMWLSALSNPLNLMFNRDLVEQPFARQWLVWFSSLVKTPGGSEWWAEVRARHVSDFASRVDQLANDADVPAAADLGRWFALADAEVEA